MGLIKSFDPCYSRILVYVDSESDEMGECINTSNGVAMDCLP